MERQNPYLNNIAFYILMIFAFVIMLTNSFAEALAVLMLFIWIAQSLVYRRQGWLDYPLFKPIVALIGLKILVLIVSGYQGEFGAVFEQLSLPFLYFIVPTIVATSERRRKIIWLIITGAIFASGVGMIRYGLGIDSRASSFVSGCYTLSIYLAIVLALVLTIYAYSSKIKEKLFLSLVSVPIITALVYTFTRASYLAAGIAILILGFFKDIKVLIPVLLVLAGIYVIDPHCTDIITQRFDTSDIEQFYSHRDILLELSLSEMQKVGFFGNGINSFASLVNVQTEPGIRNKTINSWHNMYLEYILDDGPLALVILFWLLFNQTRYSLARFRKTIDREQKIFQLGFIFVVLIIIIIGFFADPLRDPIISMLTWTLLGLSLI